MKKIFLFCAIVALMLSYSCTHQQQPQQAVAAGNEPTPVEQHGALSVQGRYIVDSKGEKVQLRGVSFGWHNWWHRFFNEAAVTKMAKEWKASVVRCSIGLDLDDNCYDKNPELAYATVDSMVNAAVKNGIYIIVDFHSHKNNLPLAKEFFGVVSKKYGNIPNIIYEIWNEPLEVEWAETKAYSEELIPVIRANAPDAIVIVPTPRWDQTIWCIRCTIIRPRTRNTCSTRHDMQWAKGCRCSYPSREACSTLVMVSSTWIHGRHGLILPVKIP